MKIYIKLTMELNFREIKMYKQITVSIFSSYFGDDASCK